MCGILCLITYDTNSFNLKLFEHALKKLYPRGPDQNNYITGSSPMLASQNSVFMGFTRLAIIDTSSNGLQPFADESNNHIICCNGEIYNYHKLANKFNIKTVSTSDCAILPELFKRFGFQKVVRDELDGEFAICYYDKSTNIIHAARDRYGVRPLYYGYNKTTKTFGFGSELKALHELMDDIYQVPPNLIFSFDLNKSFHTEPNIIEYFSYDTLNHVDELYTVESIQDQIRFIFHNAVEKRLYADRKIGFLLSGGLDSSLIVALATKILGPHNIICFTIGLPNSPDVLAAKEVCAYLKIPNENHHIVEFNIQNAIEIIPEVIYTIETYDITTIRASTPQYIMAKYISTQTDIKVILSGEGSDEVHGSYKYFRSAPNGVEFHKETIRLLKELCYFDNKRTDRTMAGNGLEVRVPFLDYDYVKFIKKIDPKLLMYVKGSQIEKQILRDAFIGYLPDNLLYRPKEAFSDAVSDSVTCWYKLIQEHANNIISDDDLLNNKYIINKPQIKEALYYRNIFDSIYNNRDRIIPHYWLPRFQEKEINEPSATIL